MSDYLSWRDATDEQRHAAVAKHDKAADNIHNGRGDYHQESDDLIDAQHEGLPPAGLRWKWRAR